MKINDIDLCVGFCDTAYCTNVKCPNWIKAAKREEELKLSKLYGLMSELTNENAGDRV